LITVAAFDLSWQEDKRIRRHEADALPRVLPSSLSSCPISE
jgi:hypothetical protein